MGKPKGDLSIEAQTFFSRFSKFFLTVTNDSVFTGNKRGVSLRDIHGGASEVWDAGRDQPEEGDHSRIPHRTSWPHIRPRASAFIAQDGPVRSDDVNRVRIRPDAHQLEMRPNSRFAATQPTRKLPLLQ